jgi:ornithine cyclodeaminase
MRYLDDDAVTSALSWSDAVDALERALLGGLDPAGGIPRQVVDVARGHLLLMPAEAGTGVSGVKVVTVAPDNPAAGHPRIQGVYVLFDDTLAPVAVLDGSALTTVRTPAVSALAVRHLAAPNAAHLVVFGAGPQALGHVEALRAVRPVTSVTVVGRTADRVSALVERARALGLAADAGTPDAVADADLVVCATTARAPLFDAAAVPDGACVVAVGSHEPEARELDGALFARAERVVVEETGVAMREAGDVVLAVREGHLDPGRLVGLADAVKAEPPDGGGGPTIFKSVGMGWQDLVVADAVWRRQTSDP